MAQLTLAAKVRKETGKKAVKATRAAGKIPAVVYNEKGESTAIEVDIVEFNKVWRNITKTTLITLDVEGKACDAFISDVDYDIMTDTVVHADFFAVSNTKKLVRSYKIQYTGTAAGVLKGGFMVKHVPEVQIRALPKDLPVRIVADVSKVNIGDLLTVKDLGLADSIELLTPGDTVLVTIAPPRAK